MKKDYAVNVKSINSVEDWNTSDMADWFTSYEEAMTAAEEAFEDEDVAEAVVTVFEDGDVSGSPLHMVRENGIVLQYQNGQRLWV